jgi:hypothetical protein
MLVVLALAAVFAIGCDDSPESGRAIAAVSDINGGVPVDVSVSAATNADVPMTFRWRPYNDVDGVISEAAPHGDIIVEHYRITWTREDGGTVIPPREEETSIFIPVYDLVSGSVRLVTPAEKAVVAPVPVNMIVNIEFQAREMGNDHEIEFATTFTVHFVP